MNDLQLAGSALYYLYSLFGSVSFGYLVLRLGYPDARVFSDEEKLGASALIGFLMFIIAILIDAIISGIDNVAVASGFSAAAFLVVMVFIVIVFKMYFSSNPVQTQTVAVPVSSDAVLTKIASKLSEKNIILAAQMTPYVQVITPASTQIRDNINVETVGGKQASDNLKLVPFPSEPFARKEKEEKKTKPLQETKEQLVQPKRGELKLEEILKDEVLSALKQQNQPSTGTSTIPQNNAAKQEGGLNEIRDKLTQLKAKGVIPSGPSNDTPQPKQEETKPGQVQRFGQEPNVKQEQIVVHENVRETERLKLRLQDAEAETILKDIGEHDVVQEARKHRLYLNPHAATQRRAQPQDDSTEFAKDVYSKTLEQKPTEAKQQERLNRRQEQKKEEQKPQQPTGTKELSMKDLFGDAPGTNPTTGGEQKESSPLFQQLNAISTKKEHAIPQSVDVKLAPKSVAGCPTCNAKTSRIVFCPYCGTGMCANCSPAIKPVEDGFVYTCPKCSEDVFVKKQSKQVQTQPQDGYQKSV